MPRRNGSYFGYTVSPTPSVASGIWRVSEAEQFLRVNKWPATPGVPGSPAGTPGNGQVSLTWSATTLGSPPTDYQIQYSSDSGATWTTFSDGTSTATSAVVTGLTNGTGYIFRVRAVNALGDGPYGAASRTVTPTAPNATLLLHFNGTNGSTTFTDSSPNGLTVTAYGDAQISTAESKFGGASALFDGDGDYLEIADTSALEFGSDDFTVEAWIYVPSTASGETMCVASKYIANASASQSSWKLLLLDDGRVGGNICVGTTELYGYGPVASVYDSWHHVAFVRSGDTWRIYWDGAQVSFNLYAGTPNVITGSVNDISQPVRVGARAYGGASPDLNFNGYIDELRIVKGTAVYTDDFTPPTSAFPNG